MRRRAWWSMNSAVTSVPVTWEARTSPSWLTSANARSNRSAGIRSTRRAVPWPTVSELRSMPPFDSAMSMTSVKVGAQRALVDLQRERPVAVDLREVDAGLRFAGSAGDLLGRGGGGGGG